MDQVWDVFWDAAWGYRSKQAEQHTGALSLVWSEAGDLDARMNVRAEDETVAFRLFREAVGERTRILLPSAPEWWRYAIDMGDAHVERTDEREFRIEVKDGLLMELIFRAPESEALRERDRVVALMVELG